MGPLFRTLSQTAMFCLRIYLRCQKNPLLENSFEVQLNREDTRQVEPGGGGGEKKWTGIFGSVSESESSF